MNLTNIFLIIISFVLGVCFKKVFPAYIIKKSENLATKQDIAEITKKTEEVRKDFKEQFEIFSSDVKFKYDFYYKQYSELYCKLYAIVVQSEYLRHFLCIKDNKNISFDEAPFLEMSPIKKQTNTIDKNGGGSIFKIKTEWIETPISNFNKKHLCDYIIEKGEFASQNLLKLAVSYRVAYEYYSGNKDNNLSEDSDVRKLRKVADEEEFRLIRELVCCIVKEYNSLKETLKTSYDEKELKSGIVKLNTISRGMK